MLGVLPFNLGDRLKSHLDSLDGSSNATDPSSVEEGSASTDASTKAAAAGARNSAVGNPIHVDGPASKVRP